MKSSEMRLLYIILAKLFCIIWMPHFFLYKWHVFKKFKNSLEACFYKHCFYIFIINLGESKIIECFVPIWKLFIETQTSGTLYRRMATVDASDNKWQWVTTNDNEWYNEWGNEWYNEWQRMKTNDNEWK